MSTELEIKKSKTSGTYYVSGTTHKTDETVKALLKKGGAKYKTTGKEGATWYFDSDDLDKMKGFVKKANAIIKQSKKALDSDSEESSRDSKRKSTKGKGKAKAKDSDDDSSTDKPKASSKGKGKGKADKSDSSSDEPVKRKTAPSGGRTVPVSNKNGSGSKASVTTTKNSKVEESSSEGTTEDQPERKKVGKPATVVKSKETSKTESKEEAGEDNERSKDKEKGPRVIENQLQLFQVHSETTLITQDGVEYRAYVCFLPVLKKDSHVLINNIVYRITGVMVERSHQAVPENAEADGTEPITISVVNGEYKVIMDRDTLVPVQVIQ